MKRFEEIKKVINLHKGNLKKKFKVIKIGIFGSYVRGEEKEGSDIDILVEFGEPVSFFEFIDLEEYMKALLGVEVDLVSKKGLNPYIGEYILDEVVYV